MKYIVFLLLIFGLSGCSEENAPAGNTDFTVTIPLENDIQTLDPATLSDPNSSKIVWQIFEGLVGLNKHGELIPLLAESWKASDDFREWIFSIRRDAQFHAHPAFPSGRGRMIVASDVKYSYERSAKGFGSFIFSGLVVGFDEYINGNVKSIAGFVANEQNEFKIRLTKPDPSFLYRISSPYLGIMPQEVVEADPDAFGKSIAIGTGPFRLNNRSGNEVVLERNREYWRDTQGTIKRIVFRVEKNSQIRVREYLNNRYDIMGIPSAHIPNWVYPDFPKTFPDRMT